MRGHVLAARDKKVQKMARDGLVEQNLTKGTVQRVSRRTQDMQPGGDKAHGPEPEKPGQCESGGKQRQGAGKQRPAAMAAQTWETAADRLGDATAPEAWQPRNAPGSMRDAGDRLMAGNPGSMPAAGDAADAPAWEGRQEADSIAAAPGDGAGRPGNPSDGALLRRGMRSGHMLVKSGGRKRRAAKHREAAWASAEASPAASRVSLASQAGHARGKNRIRHRAWQGSLQFGAADGKPAQTDGRADAVQGSGQDNPAGTGMDAGLHHEPNAIATDGNGSPGKEYGQEIQPQGRNQGSKAIGKAACPAQKKRRAARGLARTGESRQEKAAERDAQKSTSRSGFSDTGQKEEPPESAHTSKAYGTPDAGGSPPPPARAAHPADAKAVDNERNVQAAGCRMRMEKGTQLMQGRPCLRPGHAGAAAGAIGMDARTAAKRECTDGRAGASRTAGVAGQAEAAGGHAPPLRDSVLDRAELDRAELPESSGHGQEAGHAQGQVRREKKFEKAARHVQRAETKLEKAQAKMDGGRRSRMQEQYDSASGKVRHRLRFEWKTESGDGKPPLPARAGKIAMRAAAMKAHQKIHEAEKENVGVEAAHKTGSAAGHIAGRALRWGRRRLQEKPCRDLRRAERHTAKARAEMAYQELLVKNPGLKGRGFSKWVQKQKIKRSYAAAARAEGTAGNVAGAGKPAGIPSRAAHALAHFVPGKKGIAGALAAILLSVACFGSLFSSCAAMFTGLQSAVLSTCYTASDADINAAELRYTEMEAGLQGEIAGTEGSFPGYDEYSYNIGEIGHNPYELMGYLSASFGDFTYAQAEPELERLFGLQYRLVRAESTETRTYTDIWGDEQEQECRILKTTLYVRPLSEIIAASLAAGGQADAYAVYMQTCGNRQCYGNPFGTAWIGSVTAPYGYIADSATGDTVLHRGIDIGAAYGAPVMAVQDGRVVSSRHATGYGLCVEVEGEDGYTSKYACCSSVSVTVGQEVKRGDVIAAVGTGEGSASPHLHLEVMHGGEYLNPYYYVDNGGSGYTAGGGAAALPEITGDPGSAMADGSFAAMLAEAEKYIGHPYVWGGSSPSTGFDCSGFVSWVVNNSGTGSVGRQTAQGLYNLCAPVAKADLQPGDLVFFTGTYSTASPVTHVGIYVGGGRMIHCGDPIGYADIFSSSYWLSHYYAGGRLP